MKCAPLNTTVKKNMIWENIYEIKISRKTQATMAIWKKNAKHMYTYKHAKKYSHPQIINSDPWVILFLYIYIQIFFKFL